MSAIRNVCKNVFCLFLFICAPTYIYSDCDCCPQSFEFIDDCEENEEIDDDCITRENCFTDRSCKKDKKRKLSYYLFVEDFINSFIEIPTSNVLVDSTTISSKYLAGRAPIYNLQNEKVGTCSASFLCIQNQDGSIFTDISNYLSVNNGLIVSWFTPTTLINLELDTIVHSMVTECIVKASTKIGFNPFYGKTFNMIVSSDSKKIYFKLHKI